MGASSGKKADGSKITLSRLKKLPKVELHRHLEGSVRPETIFEIGSRLGLELPASTAAELRRSLYIKEPGLPFREILGRFDLAQRCLAGREEIERIAFEVAEDAFRDNILLLELRFSPAYAAQGHRIDWSTMLDAVRAGAGKASRQYGTAIGIILISSRDLGVEACRKTVDLAIESRESVVGIDLAGEEEGWPCEMFSREFMRAKEAGLKITVHAGELGSSRDMRDAVEKLGADRIGHGLKAADDEDLMDFLAEKGVTLELCPTSNMVTGAARTPDEYPLRKFIGKGVKITINADDPEIFGITLSHEYEFAIRTLGLLPNEVSGTIGTALASSFVKDEDKARVRTKILA
ncbi:MAG: adenosine deaminase [Candidatus Eisenbacteria bacterium]|nr:adenosine deaminase [Candidatus Eisenbacteria bacterium]